MIHRFGDCEIDAARRELRRAGRPVHVEPQVFDLLLVLVRHAGEVVSKDRLVAEVWRGLAVSDATINARISAARAAVGDTGKEQKVIVTVPRRGFRLRGETLRDDPTAQADGADPGPAPPVNYAASRDGTAIAWSESGAGPPLIRIGHWLSHLELDWRGSIWSAQIARFSRRHRLIRSDPRGTGLSQRGAPLDGLEVFVDDLEAVADAAGVATCDLFAASQAAPVAVAFAARAPDRVRRIVILGGYVEGRALRPEHGGTVDEPTILGMIRAGWGRPDSAFLRAFSTVFMPDGTGAQLDEMVRLQTATADAETAVRLREAIDNFDVGPLLAKVTCPVLVFHAEGDAVHPISQGQKLAAGLGDARFVRLATRNHVLLPQDPEWERVMSMTEAFLAN